MSGLLHFDETSAGRSEFLVLRSKNRRVSGGRRGGNRIGANWVLTAVPLDEIGKDGLVLSGQKVLKRPFEGFTVGEIDAELFAEENKIAPRIPITPRKLVDQLFNAGRALGNNFPVLAAAEDHRLVEGARQLSALANKIQRGKVTAILLSAPPARWPRPNAIDVRRLTPYFLI